MIAQFPARVDVAIVGAGFAGCATARALARHGVSALVIEREPALGRHASGRGAGLGRQLAEDDATTALTIRGAAALRQHYPEAWAPTGGILGFDDPTHAEAYVARARAHGVAHELIGRAAVLAHWPQLAGLPIAAAIHAPGDGTIDVRRALDQMSDGLPIATGTPVHRAHAGGVETARGPVEARVVVDASGGWAGSLTADPPLDVRKRHLFVLEAAAPTLAPFFWHLGTDELYVRSSGDGILVSPCDGEATPPQPQEPSPDADARLRARLDAAAPGWRSGIARRWACQRAFAADRQMRLGRDATRPWLVWAAALGGHGATAAPAVGEVVAEAVLEALS